MAAIVTGDKIDVISETKAFGCHTDGKLAVAAGNADHDAARFQPPEECRKVEHRDSRCNTVAEDLVD